MFIDPYHPAYKLSPMIGRLPLGDPVRAVSSVYDLEVMLHHGEDAKSVSQAVAALGGNVTFVQADIIRVELNRDKLAALAALEPVASIVELTPNFVHGEETTTTMQTGKWNLGSIP